MNWWQRLKKNSLARFGATLLLVFYVAVIAADFVGPYDPYDSQPNGSLLPPTQIYWRNSAGSFVGPHIYPTTQGIDKLGNGRSQAGRGSSKASLVSSINFWTSIPIITAEFATAPEV